MSIGTKTHLVPLLNFLFHFQKKRPSDIVFVVHLAPQLTQDLFVCYSLNVYGETAFFTVCELGDESLVQVFLEDPRVMVNLQSHKGQTPAWEAAFQGHVEVITLLLECNRDVDWTTPTGPAHWEPNTTPLQIARKEGNTEVARVIEERLARTKSATVTGKDLQKQVSP